MKKPNEAKKFKLLYNTQSFLDAYNSEVEADEKLTLDDLIAAIHANLDEVYTGDDTNGEELLIFTPSEYLEFCVNNKIDLPKSEIKWIISKWALSKSLQNLVEQSERETYKRQKFKGEPIKGKSYEKTIIALKHVLNLPVTDKDIANVIGTSDSRVTEIQRDAFTKVKDRMEKRGLAQEEVLDILRSRMEKQHPLSV